MVHKPRTPETSAALTHEEIAALEIFREVAALRPELVARAGVRRRRLCEGHILYREGERGNTSFYVERGTIALFASAPPARSRLSIAALWDRFSAWMEDVWRPDPRRSKTHKPEPAAGGVPQEIRSQDSAQSEQPRSELPASWVLLDRPRRFHYRHPARLLAQGTLFEELTSLNAARERMVGGEGRRDRGSYPRPAAAQARTAAVVLELDHAALLALREAGPLKAQLDQAMQRVTSDHWLAGGVPVPDEELTTLQIKGMNPFAGIARLLADQPGSVIRRTFKAGDVVCRQGDFGNTAFIIEKGSVTVSLEKRAPRITGQEGDMSGVLAGRGTRKVKVIFTDSGDLAQASPLATLGEGEIFGEMTCMNFYPRAATVTAAQDCTLIEIMRNVLDLLKRTGPYKDKLDADYRDRALALHLRHVPIFQDLPDETIAKLRKKAHFERISRLDKDGKELTNPADYTICKEGDAADAFYLVRSGTVRVSRRSAGGAIVLPYLSRGDFFGEVGLLLGGVRTATCEAVDRVELVRIEKKAFDAVMREFPDLGAKLMKVASERLEQAARAQYGSVGSHHSQVVAQDLMSAQDLLLIDLNACTRCDACVQACADTHGGVARLPRDGQRVDNYLVTSACRSCRDPACMIGCPVGSIRRKDGLEIIIEDWCVGCGRCEAQCPYGSIAMHYFRTEEPGSRGDPMAPVKRQALGCDLCAGFPEPNCVHACPHDCAIRVDPLRFFGGPGAPGESGPGGPAGPGGMREP